MAPHPAAPHQGTSPALIRGRKGFRQTVLCGQARPVKRGWRRRPHGARVRARRAWRSAGRHEDACQAVWQHRVVPRGLVRSWCSGSLVRLRGRPGPRTTPLPGSAWARAYCGSARVRPFRAVPRRSVGTLPRVSPRLNRGRVPMPDPTAAGGVIQRGFPRPSVRAIRRYERL